MKIFLIIFSALFISGEAIGQSYGGGGGGPNAFYYLPFTPREVAMGNAGVASSSGPFAAYWNPANAFDTSLRQQKEWISFGAVFRSRIFDAKPQWAFDNRSEMNVADGSLLMQYCSDANSGLAFNFGIQSRHIDGIKKTTISAQSDEIIEYPNSFGYLENIIRFGLATFNVGLEGMDLGVNWRIANSTIDDTISWSIRNFDIGMRGRWDKWTLGAVINIDRDSSKNRTSQYRYYFGANHVMWGVLFCLDFGKSNYDPFKYCFGLEWSVEKHIILRSGVSGGDSYDSYSAFRLVDQPSVGFGMNLFPGKMQIGVDFSWTWWLGSGNAEYIQFVDAPLKMGINVSF